MTDIDYNLLSEEARLSAVKQYGLSIQWIKNPSEKVQLAAVNKNGWAIQYIDNPTEEIQLVAVKQKSYSIRCIDNPSEEVQLFALEYRWTREFYEECIKDLPNKAEWFNKEFNRLKLVKGPLK